ncbi:hypothetical protein QE369_003626 [Agrobacterium larrymoorei]|uniref:NACHT domain-containing protein n=1 Tax=Agrobacterium larrymoorei TaxID=160699 RepID=A0AAJ2BII6_9HYPH|nr:pentapeptide repeat-containing protein [Agrobacterium larrymoorei]MDR6103429.1 hypothetical protein [Agrobacterium larrymoorei]
MSIVLTPPVKKKNFANAGFNGILAVLEAIGPTGPNIPNVLQNLKAGYDALTGTPDDTVGSRAWVWAFKTITYAVADALKAQQGRAPLSRQKDDAVKKFLATACDFEGQQLTASALANPGLSPIFDKARQEFGNLVLQATTGADIGLETLYENFNESLRASSNRAVAEDPTYFKAIEDALTGLAGEGTRRDAHWARHAHWISQQFTDTPVFSPDEDEVIPLEKVYLPLRCYWHQSVKREQESGNERSEFHAHVGELHSVVHAWLNTDPRREPIRVVTGGPGSGKSSFARAFAHEVIKQGKHRVLFMQMQHMSVTGSLQDDIARYVDRRDTATGKSGSPGLPGNPFDWRKSDEKPILLIFDGLDELSTKEEDGERYARELLLALKLMLSPINTDGTPVRALVLGRNVACQAALAAANMSTHCLLNVAPIARMTADTLHPSSGTPSDVHDPEQLVGKDQREEYWQKWAPLKGLDPKKIPNVITAKSMEELNVEPLLLHLLMISSYSGDDWEIAANNKNVVYEDILLKIFERNKNKDHFRAAGVDQALFFGLMECLAIAAWRGNGRTGDESDFRLVRKLHLNRERQFKEFPAASLKSVALNIHTRAGQDDADSGFEFIHKSFGEYLAARGLLSHAIKTVGALEESEPEDIELQWCQLIGGAELTSEIINFLYNEACLRMQPETASAYKEKLTEFVDWVLIYGFSVHKAAPETGWSQLATNQRCALAALFATASAMAFVIPIGDWDAVEFNPHWTLNIKWPDAKNFTVKRKLYDVGVSDEHPVIGALRRLNLADTSLWDASLSRIDIEGADLRYARLNWSIFIGSNLSNVNMCCVNAAHTKFLFTDLRSSDLSYGDFEYSFFRSVEMRNCKLAGVNFSNADASSDDGFRAANTFTGSLVKGSIDFEGADLTGAFLHNADLSGALNLTVEALNSAIGDATTITPDYIDRSQIKWAETITKKQEPFFTQQQKHFERREKLRNLVGTGNS